VILMYHRIAEAAEDPFHLCIPPRRFADQLEILRSEYTLAPLGELLFRLRKERFPRKMVAITLDDGYSDNLQTAAPILEQYAAPATVFVTTGYLDGRREFWWDDLVRLVMESRSDPSAWSLSIDGKRTTWPEGSPREKVCAGIHDALRSLGALERDNILDAAASQAGIPRTVRPGHRPLAAEEIRLLARSGLVDIGAHTINHLWLAAHPPAEQERELSGAKRDLEDILGFPVRSLAYPYGKRDSVGRATLSIARAAGYQLACANVRGQVFTGVDPLWLPRMTPGNVDGEEFRARMRSCFGEYALPHEPRGMEG
jgi:peptidoglycan/xylan/chitin deacetylase (PgdA/CDA1 family)